MTHLLVLLIAVSCFSQRAFSQAYGAGGPKEWKDITDKKYSGKDADLDGFNIKEPEVTCDYIQRKCAVRWSTSTSRDFPAGCGYGECRYQELEHYTMHFQVKDRKGNVIYSNSYKRDRNVRDKKEGYIDPNDPLAQWGDVSLKYTTIEYWVQSIKWKDAKKRKPAPADKIGFSLKDTLSKANKEKNENTKPTTQEAQKTLIKVESIGKPIAEIAGTEFKKIYLIKGILSANFKFSHTDSLEPKTIDPSGFPDSKCSKFGCLAAIVTLDPPDSSYGRPVQQAKKMANQLLSEASVQACRVTSGFLKDKEQCQYLFLNSGMYHFVEPESRDKASGSESLLVVTWSKSTGAQSIDRIKIGSGENEKKIDLK